MSGFLASLAYYADQLPTKAITLTRRASLALFQHVFDAVLQRRRNGVLRNFDGLGAGRPLARDLVAERVGLAGRRRRDLLRIGEQRLDGLLIGRRQIRMRHLA